MIQTILKKIVGTHHERERKRLWPVVQRITALEPEIQKLTDEQLRAKTDEFRGRIQKDLEAHGFPRPTPAEWYAMDMDDRNDLKKKRRQVQQKVLDAVLPEAFAVVREVSRRQVNMRHFDVQLMGGMVLHEGKISEMTTGEGKTLVATLPAYLNALTGRGVHLVTVNDYLARRDARWMGPIYHALGLSVGVIQGVDPVERRAGDESLSFIYDPSFAGSSDRFLHMRPVSRPEAYRADITYGQNNEFGFDYLRDNMRFSLEGMSQGDHHFAIVDEVDSILIDEARTPLIISGPAEESTDLYARLDKVSRQLKKGDMYEVDEKAHTVALTDAGIAKSEELLGVANLYDETNMRLVHHIHQALRAHELFRRDVDYVVKDNEIIIVDEFTGRLMPGRRWSDGLHQAIEAKEGVRIRQENQTLATVTFQNYFRMYEKLAGMTGTASTEAQEFTEIYKLDVVGIPTNRNLIRQNHADVVFRTEPEKFIAAVEEIVDLHRAGRPVLIGTISIEKSEFLSRLLREPGPFIQRLGLVAQQAMEDLKKEPLPGDLKPRVEKLFSRPAMMDDAEAKNLLVDLKTKVPKSMLVFRVEDALRLNGTIAAVREGMKHSVLNAKYHEHEARIIAQAGRKGAITIATNMAGRGTDILLGGSPQALAADTIREEETKREAPLSDDEKRAIEAKYTEECAKEHEEVVAVGGLHVLGTERHEARRIDNQLRGRSGRQGDPGSSRFYLSLADDLMRIFGGDRLAKMMDMKFFAWEEGLPIESGLVTRAIEQAQRQVEGHNFESRKHLLEYDNTMNRQREVIYEQRRRIVEGVDLDGLIKEIIREVVDDLVETFCAKESRPDAWDIEGFKKALDATFGMAWPADASAENREALADSLQEAFEKTYAAKREQFGERTMAVVESRVLLSTLDLKWKDHLYMMDALKEGIGLRAYGQRDPVVEYQREAYRMFQDMITSVKQEALMMLLRVRPVEDAQPRSVFETMPKQEVHPDAPSLPAMPPGGSDAMAGGEFIPDAPRAQPVRPAQAARPLQVPPGARAPGSAVPVGGGPKVGRNDPCPCGSGQKFKKCHGK